MFEDYKTKDWRDSFNEFSNNYKNFNEFRRQIPKLAEAGALEPYLNIFCQNYCVLFNQAVDSIKYFLQEKGLFQKEKKLILSEAYYVELIDDGQIWVDALTLVDYYEAGKVTDALKNLIIVYSTDNYFKIFDKLNKTLEEMAG